MLLYKKRLERIMNGVQKGVLLGAIIIITIISEVNVV
jgi:hypothetical protein